MSPDPRINAETRSWIAKAVVTGGLVACVGYGAYCAWMGDAAGLRNTVGTAASALFLVIGYYFSRKA